MQNDSLTKEVKLYNVDCFCRIYHLCPFACKLIAYHDPIFDVAFILRQNWIRSDNAHCYVHTYSLTRNTASIESQLEISRTRRNFLPVILYFRILYLYFSRYFSPIIECRAVIPDRGWFWLCASSVSRCPLNWGLRGKKKIGDYKTIPVFEI